jgi:protein subunit release factor A
VRPSTKGQGDFAVSLEISGDNLEKLSNESGGHRWQRIPPTEKRDRVHTSTVTVSVTDPDSQSEFVFAEQDLSLSWFSGTGKGGQNRNKVQSCCRLTHVPSGITITAQTRSRENSYKQARTELEQKLYQIHCSEFQQKISADKRTQVGSGQRGDKIRTYRLQHDDITDHRTGKSINCRELSKGMIDKLWH